MRYGKMKTLFEGETGKFVRNNTEAELSYAIIEGIYYLEHLDDKGWDFLKFLDFGSEIVLYKDNGETVNLVIVDLGSIRKAKVKP